MNILKRKVSLSASIIVVAFVAILVVGGVVMAYQGIAPQNVFEAGSNISIDQTSIEVPSENNDDELGGTGSPVIPYNFLTVGGLTRHYQDSGMATATTTVCSLKSPSATSTMTFGSVNFLTSSTVASTVTIAKSDSRNASTTLLAYDTALGANTGLAIVASTTNSVYKGAEVFTPNQYFNVTMKGGGTFSPTGRCKVEWTQIPN